MNLQRQREEEVEVNLTPLIDVVFLLLIFFMVSTTFVRESEINLSLPEASKESPKIERQQVEVAVDAQGTYFVDGKALLNSKLETIRRAIGEAAAEFEEPIIVVSADAGAAHQDVVDILDAARQLGYVRISFTTEVRDDGR